MEESSNHQRETKDINERITLNVGGIKDNKICISDLETGVNINNCYKGLRILSDNIEKELEKKFPGIKFMNYNYNNYRQLRITLNYDFYQVLLISQKKLEFDYFQIPYPNQRLYEIDDDEVYSHSRTLKLKFATVIKNFRERESSNHQRETKDIDERVTLNVGGIKFSDDNKICTSDLEIGVNNCYNAIQIIHSKIKEKLEIKFPSIECQYGYYDMPNLAISWNSDFLINIIN
ncbi:168_t:CDS:2 [Entrophospora sp. SA101]|nr:168_t:CDS:2 [Entrophospora sp. SA101]